MSVDVRYHQTGLHALAASATLHCLAGCAVGEILGMVVGTAAELDRVATIALAVGLAFVFGFAFSALPLLSAGLAWAAALKVVVLADTLSIAVMELVENAAMAVIPGAMDAGLVNPTFWLSMTFALGLAYVAAYPVNRHLLVKGKGHALLHEHHEAQHDPMDPTVGSVPTPRRLPTISSTTLAAVILAFMLGALVVSVAADSDAESPSPAHASGR